MTTEPKTKAGRELLEREAFNARSFALITTDAILAIEAEAARLALEDVAERVKVCVKFALVDAPGLDFVLAEDILALPSTKEKEAERRMTTETEPRTEAQEFWDTHCTDCAHDLHPMNVCSAIVGGDHNGPDYCPCTIDYHLLAAAYQARAEATRLALEDVAERVRALPTFDDGTMSRSTDVVLPYVDRAAVLALLSTKEEGS